METKELEFPCHYPIKVICNNESGISDLIASIVKDHVPDYDPSSLVAQTSRNGTFVSLRISFQASSRKQLDDLHQAIMATGRVKMVI